MDLFSAIGAIPKSIASSNDRAKSNIDDVQSSRKSNYSHARNVSSNKKFKNETTSKTRLLSDYRRGDTFERPNMYRNDNLAEKTEEKYSSNTDITNRKIDNTTEVYRSELNDDIITEPYRKSSSNTRAKISGFNNGEEFRKPFFGYKRLEELLTKESHEIVSVIQNPKSGFVDMIKTEELKNKPDWLMMIFRLLSKICSSELVDSKGEILSCLCCDNLLNQLNAYLGDVVVEKRPSPLKNMATFIEDAIYLCKCVVDIIPRTARSKNFVALMTKLKVAIGNVKDVLNISVDPSCSATLDTALSILNEKEADNGTDTKKSFFDSLHDCPPPNNFREISLYPTIDDLYDEKPFIRPNITKGAYKDVDHYLDVQFRLLREDFIAPLRAGLKAFISEEKTNVKPGLRIKNKYDSVRLYFDTQIVDSYVSENKVGYTICFDKSNKFSAKTNWEYSKRFMYGSLLVFTRDNFQTFFLATVSDRDVNSLKKGMINISMVGNEKVSGLAFENIYLMAESEVYFEPYYLVMKSLQTIKLEKFPMKNYIVDANMTDMSNPRYLEQESIWSIGDDTFNILNIDDWPSWSDLGLDEFQYNAFQTALTKEFAVIQGPPGTGKTFLGLKIVETLLNNLDKYALRSPILLVCYTNHALDQFLEGILRHTQEIIRIGGQSKSEILKNYNLRSNHVRSAIPRSRDTTGALKDLRSQIRDLVSILKHTLTEREKLQKIEGVLSFGSLIPVIHPRHRYAFKNDEQFLSWLTDIPEMYKFSSSDYDFMFDDRGNLRIDAALSLQRINEALFVERTSSSSVVVTNIDDNEDDYELCDIYDEDEIFTGGASKPNVSNIRFAHEFNNIQKYIEQLIEQVKCCSRNLEDGTVSYAMYHNTYSRVNHDVKQLLRRHNFIKHKLQQIKQIKSSDTTYTDANYKSLKHVPADLRWLLYDKWVKQLNNRLISDFKDDESSYRRKYNLYEELKQMEGIAAVRTARVVGITTTGAARLQTLLRTLKAEIVVIEEAAEVLESHIIVSLTQNCQHVILIGDHKQLKPSTAVYALSKRYNFDLSLFERMINNGMNCPRLNIQHRMRPEISSLIAPLIYKDLDNHQSVYNFPNVLGIKQNLYFITHKHLEHQVTETKSRTNIHEAEFLIELCRYILLQGYSPEKITILTTYTGQMYELRKAKKERSELKNVRTIVVDKYQGEENDIVLLSLVRSNEENKIGFLGIENRVCVALSRARIGFYIIGNMGSLSTASTIWANIKETLEKQNAIGDSLTLVCQIHNIETNVSCKDDFNKVSEGGCSASCGTLLSCGHNCTSMCHVSDSNHKEYKCHAPCAKSCAFDHPCQRKCYEQCGKCMVTVTRTLKCDHSHKMSCHQDPEHFKCSVEMKVVLPKCNHECSKPCYQDIERFLCPFPCEDRLNCGHACTKNCHKNDDPDHNLYQCKKPCTRKNKGCTREHYCKKLCFEECGKCTVHVEQNLSCGHPVNIHCSADIVGIKCFKGCAKTMPCGHKCNKRCSQPCEPCHVRVDKKISACGHEVKVECWYTPDPSLCKKRCERTRQCGHPCKGICGKPCDAAKCMELVPIGLKLICGHDKSYVYCYERDTAFAPDDEKLLQLCQEKCSAILSCNDVCSGTCGECWQGKFHKSCAQKCGNILICGHSCDYPCREMCPPCMKPCTYQCVHSKCPKRCGIPCVKCKERCNWTCKHLKCTRLCGEICNREPCYKPCDMKLTCGHPCIGFCGEPCPPLCRVCNTEEVTTIFFGYEDEENARFVYLEDCKHTVESRGLEQNLSIAPEGGEITMKRCPLCNTAITKTLRFMKYVKETYRDIIRVKKKVYGDFKDLKWKQNELIRKLRNIEPFVMVIDKFGYSEITILFDNMKKLTNFTVDNVFPRHFVSSQFILDVVINNLTMRADDLNKINSRLKDKLKRRINCLLRKINRLDLKLVRQHMDDIRAEMTRYHRLIDLYQLESTPEFEMNKHLPDVKDTYERLSIIVLEHDRYDVDNESKASDLYERLKTFVKSRCGLSDDERRQIHKAMSKSFYGGEQSQGHWFKCPNGHIYVITECGGAMQEAVCPEKGCGLRIGGQNHRYVDDAQLASEMDGATRPAWSSGMDMHKTKKMIQFYQFLLNGLSQDTRPFSKVYDGYFETRTLINLVDWFCKLIDSLKSCDLAHLLCDNQKIAVCNINRLIDVVKKKTMLKKFEIEFIYDQLNKIIDLSTFYSLQKNHNFDLLLKDHELNGRLDFVRRKLLHPLESYDDDSHTQVVEALKEMAAFLRTRISVIEKAKILEIFSNEFPRAGHWFHCANCREVYAVANCGQFNQTGRCPTCKNVIGLGSSRIEVNSSYWQTN